MVSINFKYSYALDLLLTLEDNSFDALFQDLPYEETNNDWDKIPNLDLLVKEWKRILKPNGVMIFTVNMKLSIALISAMPKWFKYDLIWQKTTSTGHLNANKRPMRSHEIVLVFYNKQPTYNPQKTKNHARKVSTAKHKRNSKKSTNYNDYGLSTYDSTERFPTSVITFATDKQKSQIHPHQKPLSLVEYFILTFTNKGDLVGDFFGGSGTTAIACFNTGRSFIGCEKCPKAPHDRYFKKAEKRIKELTIQQNIFSSVSI